jgi:hypothetical protein
MNKVIHRALLGVLAIFLAPQALAGYIQNVTISGLYKVWESDNLYNPPGGLTLLPAFPALPPPPPPPSLDSFLVGDYKQPGSNIELSDELVTYAAWVAGARTTLTGDFGGPDLIMSSVGRQNFVDNDYQLVKDYVTGAAASIGLPLTDADLDLPAAGVCSGSSRKEAFVDCTPFGSAVGSLAFLIHDPNLSFVNMSELQIGLSAQLDGSAYLQALVDVFIGEGVVTVPTGATASEIVLYRWEGETEDRAFYGFSCVDSRQDAGGPGTNHATNSYSCTVPEPGALAVFSLGLVGLAWASRRNRRIASETRDH